jgi:hypothetical protein
MVVVEGDPLTRIEDARNVRTVIKNGQVLDIRTLLSGETNTIISSGSAAPRW